jgi:hypothetical protein
MSPDVPVVPQPARRALLVAALGFAELAARHPAVGALKSWLGSWNGIGAIVTGMERQGYRLHLTNIDPSVRRATFDCHCACAASGCAIAAPPRQRLGAAEGPLNRRAAGRE